jgi:hypothetical protein
MSEKAELIEAGIGYWSRLTNDELVASRQSLQKDLDEGHARSGDTAQWLGEIDTVLALPERQQPAEA